MNEELRKQVKAQIARGVPAQVALQQAQAQIQQTQSQPQPQQPQQGFLGRLAANIAAPFVGTGKNILEAGVQTGRVLFDPAFREVLFNKGDSQVVRNPDGTLRIEGGISPQAAQKVSRQPATAVIGDQQAELASKNKSQFIGDQVKRSTQIASYGVPVGKLGLFKGGAVAGGMYGAGQGVGEDRTDEQVASDVGIGAVTGGVASKVLGGIFNKIKGSGEAARRSVIKPQGGTSATAFTQKQQIMQGMDDVSKATGVKFKGSAAAQEQQVAKAYDILYKDIQSKTGKKTFDIYEVADRIKEGIPFETTADKQNFNRLVGQYVNNVMKDGKITDKDLLMLKFDLGKIANKGTSNKATLARDMWDNLDNFLQENLDGEIKTISQMQSILHKASPGIQQQVEASAQIPFVGRFESVNRIGQAMVDQFGRISTSVGGAGQQGIDSIGGGGTVAKLMGPTREALAGDKAPKSGDELLSRMNPEQFTGMTPQNADQMPQESQEILSPGGQWKWSEEAQDWVPNQTTAKNPLAEMTPEDAAMFMLSLPKEQRAAFKDAYSLLQDARKEENKDGTKLSEADKKLAQARDVAEEAYQLLNTSNFETGIPSAVKSKYQELVGTQDPEVTAFKSKITLAKSNFRTAMIGAGQTESEAKNLADAMFDLSQPRSVLVERMKAFIDAQNNYLNKYAGQSSSFEDIVGGNY